MYGFDSRPRHSKFILIGPNVITVEHAPRLMAGKLHSDFFGDTGADQVTDRTTPQIMHQQPAPSDRFTRLGPRAAKIEDGFAVVVKYERTIQPPLSMGALDHFGQFTANRQRTALFIFRFRR